MQGEPPIFLQPPVVMIVFMILMMYVLVMRPQKKAQKEHALLLSKLEKNDEVVTSGGIHGTIVSVGDHTAIVRIADAVKIEIDKSAIAHVKKKRQGTESSDK